MSPICTASIGLVLPSAIITRVPFVKHAPSPPANQQLEPGVVTHVPLVHVMVPPLLP
jgi:hypothetical protein